MLNNKKNYEINIIENYYNLDIEKIFCNNIIQDKDIYFPILNNGIIYPSNKSKHFIIPLLLSKRYLETKNIFVYDKIYQTFINDLNGTGRFFEALSTENVELDEKTLVISFGKETQHFGQIFAMGLQCVDYIHIDYEINTEEIKQIKEYKKIIFYTNELTKNNQLVEFIRNFSTNFNNIDINIACILNYIIDFEIPTISLINLDLKINKTNNIGLYKCHFPTYQNNIIKQSIDNSAKQDDNLIETIMTIMSSQDFEKIENKIKILFLCDDDFSYIPMLISEFMSGFDNYDIYFSKITNLDINEEDKIIINKDKPTYLYNVSKNNYNFMFYITKQDITYNSYIYKTLSKLKNIQNINIIKEIEKF